LTVVLAAAEEASMRAQGALLSRGEEEGKRADTEDRKQGAEMPNTELAVDGFRDRKRDGMGEENGAEYPGLNLRWCVP